MCEEVNLFGRFCVFIYVMKGICKFALTVLVMSAIAGCGSQKKADSISLPSFADSPLILGTMPDDVKSKIVLVNFFTTTSVGSARIAKSLQSLSSEYAPNGLASIFVLVPEYEYSKDINFTTSQAKKLNLEGPVVFDNKYMLWSSLLVTKCGSTIIAKDGMTADRFDPKDSLSSVEESICRLLEIENRRVFAETGALDFTSVQCGYLSGGIGNCSGNELEKIFFFNDPKSYKPGKIYLSGEWFLGQEMAWHSSTSDKGSVSFSFEGSEAFMTMRSQRSGTSQVTVWLDGKPISDEFAGEDVANSNILVSEGRPYSIAKNLDKSRSHVITVESASSDWAVYSVEIFYTPCLPSSHSALPGRELPTLTAIG